MKESRRSQIRRIENVDTFPLVALQALRELRDDLEEVEATAILRARELGASLEDIAEAMHITRQGVAYKLKHIGGNGHDQAEGHGEEKIVDLRDPEVEAPPQPSTP